MALQNDLAAVGSLFHTQDYYLSLTQVKLQV